MATTAERRTGGRNESNPIQQAEEASNELVQALRAYARRNPESAALWCLAIGFILGWKLKPW